MTRSSGVHSPHRPQASSSAGYCKQYAALPDNAHRVLTKDSIYVNHPAAAWPQRPRERCRLFQEFYHKYFQQILYGCGNPKCDKSTCLSHQTRVSRGPFRRFTVLSARSLATFLASQDNPEQGLCAHQWKSFTEPLSGAPVAPGLDKRCQRSSAKADGTNFHQSRSVNIRSTPGSYLDAIEGQAPELKRQFQDQDAKNARHHRQSPGVESRNSALQHELRMAKDPKSFTQNLFGTIAMMMLQIAKVPNERGLLKRAAWIRGEVDSTSLEESTSRCHTPSSNSRDSRDSNATWSIAEGSSGFSGAATIASSEYGDDHSSSLYERKEKPRMSESDGRTCGSMPDPNAKSQVDFQGLETLSNGNSVEDDCNTSGATSENSVRAQTLSHFTSENIMLMVSMIKDASPTAHKERHFMHSLGRTQEPIESTAFVRGNAMPRDLTVAYGMQSITSVLSSTKSLLKSFRCNNPVKSPIDTIYSTVSFEEISGAFRTLMEVDYHPSNIFPCLWHSIGDLYLPGPFRSKSPVAKTHSGIRARDSDPDIRSQVRCSDSKFTESNDLNDAEAAHVAKITLAALVASVPSCSSKDWHMFQLCRSTGQVAVSSVRRPTSHPRKINDMLEISDSFDNELALSLMTRLVRAIAARLCVSEISRNQVPNSGRDTQPFHRERDVLEIVLDGISDFDSAKSLQAPTTNTSSTGETTIHGPHVLREIQSSSIPSVSIIVEWLRSVVLREWDGKAEVARWSAVGGALEFLSYIYRDCQSLRLDPELFRTPLLSARFDVMEMPVEWLSAPNDKRVVHMLSYPFLFKPSTLVSYFRSINHGAMSKAFEASIVTGRLLADMKAGDPINGRGEPRVSEQIRRAMNNYLVLEIRRDRVLTDAMNQLWRRERCELLRPLKVRMGMEEGEEGVDHGGVQQEFFRVAISEALNSDYGLFQTDVRTRTSWFQPCALEPLYKFEILGLLASLAVYNGLTLPINFPLALYRKLLDLPVTRLAHIEDGWPELAIGFQKLLNWVDGDVEDVFVRSYIFSVDGLGSTIHVDMDKIGREVDWPLANEHKDRGDFKTLGNGSVISSESSTRAVNHSMGSSRSLGGSLENSSAGQRLIETSLSRSHESFRPRANSVKSEVGMVTNANREQYVEDYIFWLTDKSIRPQFEAFARGFYTCLDRKATTIFTAEALKSVVEGVQEIDIDALQQTTRYEGGYAAEHRVIKDFWHVVRQFSTDRLRQLLEFVTASDRIPVNGVRSILFVIQQNGLEDERLPTSLTCFGRLLLPAYSTRKKLKEKLCAAIENSKGFGVA